MKLKLSLMDYLTSILIGVLSPLGVIYIAFFFYPQAKINISGAICLVLLGMFITYRLLMLENLRNYVGWFIKEHPEIKIGELNDNSPRHRNLR